MKFISIVILLFIPLFIHAQNNTKASDKLTPEERRNQLAHQQIAQLHNSVLLVRLKTRKNAIDALRKSGKNAEADKVAEKQSQTNQLIVNAFRENYNFCPVYFFNSDYSSEIKGRHFDRVAFLNDNLQPDSSIKISKESFFIAEFGAVDQDTVKYYPGNVKPEKDYYSGESYRFSGLVIKSDQFIQLQRPFPFYVRTFDLLPIKRKPKAAVIKMNKKLHDFYRKANK